MSEPFLGQIMLFAGGFAPRGWADCAGQILSISQNTALFSLLGTNYGGNGTTNFALPDLRGRVAVNQGQGPGLNPYVIGEQDGAEGVALLATTMPSHNHGLNAATAIGTANTAAGNVLARPFRSAGGRTGDHGNIYNPGAAGTALAPAAIGTAGSGQAHNNMQPFLTLRYIIAMAGIFPSRN